MTRQTTGLSVTDIKGDTFRVSRNDDRRGNDRVAFAAFARDFLMEHSLATMTEARAAFDAERKEGSR
jgi:hypothetical protein